MTDFKLENCINKEKIMEISYLLSHIIVASILVVCLKNNKSLLLFTILSLMLGFVSYTEQNKIPIYLLALCGFIIYMLETHIINKPAPNDNNKVKKLLDTIWKIPYWAILSYYIIIISTKLKINAL